MRDPRREANAVAFFITWLSIAFFFFFFCFSSATHEEEGGPLFFAFAFAAASAASLFVLCSSSRAYCADEVKRSGNRSRISASSSTTDDLSFLRFSNSSVHTNPDTGCIPKWKQSSM